MMEKVQRRGELIAQQRLAGVKSGIKSVLAKELPEDVRVTETGGDFQLEAARLKQRLLDHSSLRDIGFLLRSVR